MKSKWVLRCSLKGATIKGRLIKLENISLDDECNNSNETTL